MKSTRGPSPLSPPLPYPLPSLLGGGHIRRRGRSGRRRGRSGMRHCGVPPCGGVAGCGVEAALPPSLPLQEEAKHGSGQARPARLREGRGCRARLRAAPSLPSPTSETGHGGDQAWPARRREVRGWAGPPAGRGHDHDGQRWQAQIPRPRLCFFHFSAPPSVTALAAAPLLANALARAVTVGVGNQVVDPPAMAERLWIY